jgi:alkanesulfonate monooxygenase SsuD/methylene tetrahydromethanopterin reductase-like flavin-dependent oxidoreductase (luciferase family)
MRFGLGVPTGTEGLMYPVPYADATQAVALAVEAERLGFESVWANDHVTTQHYVRAEFDEAPRYYDPFSYLSFVAARTSRVRLATAVMVLPFRHPVVAAKQLATLDQLSGGRLHRGEHAEESFQALTALLTHRRSSYEGRWIRYRDVESSPLPVQRPLPLLSGGNAPACRRRAGRYGHGWLPACLTPGEVALGLADIGAEAEQAGRPLPAGFEVALQVGVCVGATREEAERRFERSQLANHMRSLSRSTLKDQKGGGFAERNLIGTVDDVREQIDAYAEAGATTMAALLFAADTVPETLEMMEEFSQTVMPAYAEAPEPIR